MGKNAKNKPKENKPKGKFDDNMKKIGSFLDKKNNLIKISIILIVVMFLFTYFGYLVSTSGGNVDMREVSFRGSQDNVISSFLFVPDTATAANPAPAVLLAYGGTGLKDFMVNISIELARRGFVAMAVDTSGGGLTEHTSASVALDTMRFLRGQSFVETYNIGLVGQSMGRLVIQAIADNEPDWYRSILFLGMIPVGSPEALAEYRNMAVLMGTADETFWQGRPFNRDWFGLPWWQTHMLSGLDHTGPIQGNVIYGNIAAGTGRIS